MGAEIIRAGDYYVMYFVAKHRVRNVNCLAVASSKYIVGPYRIISEKEPLFCPAGIIGVIAPNPYQDGETGLHLLFSMFSGERGHANKGVYITKMSDDGFTVKGEPIKLIGVDQEWEHGHVEGSTLIRNEKRYYLFYTGSTYKAKRNSYAIGYASSEKITGPYTKASDNPLLQSAEGYFNPGSQAVIQDKCGNILLFFHAYPNSKMTEKRSSYVSKLHFVNKKPVIDHKFDYGSYACNNSAGGGPAGTGR